MVTWGGGTGAGGRHATTFQFVCFGSYCCSVAGWPSRVVCFCPASVRGETRHLPTCWIKHVFFGSNSSVCAGIRPSAESCAFRRLENKKNARQHVIGATTKCERRQSNQGEPLLLLLLIDVVDICCCWMSGTAAGRVSTTLVTCVLVMALIMKKTGVVVV